MQFLCHGWLEAAAITGGAYIMCFKLTTFAFLAIAATAVTSGSEAAVPHRYWPRFPRPTTLVTVPEVRSTEEAFVLQSAGGLAARAALTGPNREMVWYPLSHPAYDEWKQCMLEQTQARIVELPDVWAAVERFRKRGIIKGYVLFRMDTSQRKFHERGPYDPSPNAATVAAAQLGGVMVAESLEERARAIGLPLLADARDLTEEMCYDKWGAKCSRRVVAMLDPKLAHCRAEAIALNAFVLATYGDLLDRVLAHLEPDSPVLGWGLGDEFRLTEPVSRWGSWQSATNWCVNLPPLCTEQVGGTIAAETVRVPERSIWDLDWRDGLHYASFLMTDGDNVQWLMGEFQIGGERSWWGSPARGGVPMGWGTCIADLAQLCPYALQRLVSTATERDDLVLMGGGYYYPDLFGAARQDVEALRLHARRIRGYLRMTGVRVLHMNASKWDSPEAVRAYTIFAEEIPELEGILMIQYAPYTAGKGKVIWVKRRDGSEMPVVSARFGIWAHSPFPDDGTPAKIARLLNGMPAIGAEATESGFSWVTVHCWSWFREAPEQTTDDAELVDQSKAQELGAKRGMEPVVWCARRLSPHVRVLTPTEMVMLMNLRLRPEQTLGRALKDLDTKMRSARPAVRREAQGLLRDARRHLNQKEWRQAFEPGKAAAHLLD